MPTLTVNAEAATNTGSGDTAWLTPEAAEGSANGTGAIAGLNGTTTTTTQSLVLSFDLAELPDHAVIAGITLTPTWRDQLENTRDLAVQLYAGDVPLGDDQADGEHVPGATFAAGDPWGDAASTWGWIDPAVSVVKAADFGVRIRMEVDAASSAVPEIDAVALAITYDESSIDAGAVAAGSVDAGVIKAGTIDA